MTAERPGDSNSTRGRRARSDSRRVAASPGHGGRSSRAQSETIGFVFVFTLIVLSVSVVSVTGFGAIEDAREAEQLNNVERAFDVLDSNLRDVYREGVPSRATEIRLNGGVIRVGDPVSITVTATNTSNASDSATFGTTIRPITYRGGDGTTITSVNGAVVRSDGDSSIMLSAPRWVLDDERAVVQFVDTEGSTDSLGGQRTVLVVTRKDFSKLQGQFIAGSGASVRVNVTVTSPRADAWKGFFERQGLTPVDPNAADGTVTYGFETDAVYVPTTKITVAFEA